MRGFSRVDPSRGRIADERGFSVVEMLFVFTILAVAMLPLASVQFGSRRQINEAERQSQAIQLAQSQIEQIKMTGFGQSLGDTLTTGPFRAETIVVTDPANPFLEEIQVTVSWEYGDSPRAITLASKQAAR